MSPNAPKQSSARSLIFAALMVAMIVPVMLAMRREHDAMNEYERFWAKKREAMLAEAETDKDKAFYVAFKYHHAGNVKERRAWTEKAAKLGKLEATQELCIEAAKANDTLAFHRWLKLASDQGDGEAAFTLACEFGRGKHQNDPEALKYLERAAELNYPEATGLLEIAKAKGLDEVRERLTFKH